VTLKPPNGVGTPLVRSGANDAQAAGARANDATYDSTSAIQALLNTYNYTVVPPGTYRIDGTLTIGEYRTLELMPGATLARLTAGTASTAPVVRLSGANYSRLVGHGTVQSENASPSGVVHVGPAVQTVNTNIQRWRVWDVTIVGASATSTNIGLNLTSSEVAGPTGAGGGSNYLGSARSLDIQQVGVGVKEGELCNAHDFADNDFHLIGAYSYQLAGGTAGVSENTHSGGFTHTKASGDITVIKGERALFCEFYGVKAEPDAPGVPGSKYYDLDANSSQNRIFGFGNFETATQGVDSGSNNIILQENTLQVAELVYNTPAARVYHSADQALTSGNQVLLVFNSERFDAYAMHSTVSNTSRLTCQRAGLYRISATVAVTADATGYRQGVLLLNGATVIDVDRVLSVTVALDAVVKLGCVYQLALNDYVEVGVLQNSGSTLNALTFANWSPEFSMEYLGRQA
jgi:hypothetical protein